MMKDTTDAFAAIAVWGFLVLVTIVPIIVHIVQCVQDNWAAMLIVGLVIPPVRWVHGVGIIFGIWG